MMIDIDNRGLKKEVRVPFIQNSEMLESGGIEHDNQIVGEFGSPESYVLRRKFAGTRFEENIHPIVPLLVRKFAQLRIGFGHGNHKTLKYRNLGFEILNSG